jgi:hypothetical protein
VEYLRPARNTDPFLLTKDDLTFASLLIDWHTQEEKDAIAPDFDLSQYITVMYYSAAKSHG